MISPWFNHSSIVGYICCFNLLLLFERGIQFCYVYVLGHTHYPDLYVVCIVLTGQICGDLDVEILVCPLSFSLGLAELGLTQKMI